MGAFSKLYEFVLDPKVRTYSGIVPGTSSNNGSENQDSTGDRSLADPCPEMVFSACHTSNLNDSEQEETHHNKSSTFDIFVRRLMQITPNFREFTAICIQFFS